MSERKLRRLDLIRERHRALILKPKREAELAFQDSWEEEFDPWHSEPILDLARVGEGGDEEE